MSQVTQRRERDQWELDSAAGNTMTVENIRSATAPPVRGEERISVFWRVFGGTLLSIAALVCITFVQQFSNSLGELRANLTHLNESRGDLVKNEDFNNRMTAVWNNLKELQGANVGVVALKERSALLEQQLKTAEDERKELAHELQRLRERIAVVEGRQAATAGRRDK